MEGSPDLGDAAVQRTARSARAHGPERRVVTVMFADIVDSTRRFDGRDLEEASRELQSLVDALAIPVRRFKGVVAQEMGDGVMCLFGAPVAEEDHARQAARAALDILKTTANPAALGLPAFAVRVGLATGEVLLQPVENGLRRDLRVLGAPVNLAAKLQQSATANQILIAGPTHDLIRDGADGDWVQPSHADGPAFALRRVGAGRRTALELMSNANGGPMFGRQAELEQLRRAASRVATGEGAMLEIDGEAGIGKSRLVSEFLRAPELSGWGVLLWPQSPERRLGAAGELETLAGQLARSAGDPSAVCQAAAEASGGLARAALETCYGLPVSEPMWAGLDPAQQRAFLFEGLVAAISELSQSRPLALVVEDAHWADPDAFRLLQELHAGLDATHVLLITTSRRTAADDGDRPESGGDDAPSNRLHLDRLDDEDVRRFLDHWLGDDAGLDAVKAHLVSKSEGVPLYLEESLRCLENDGMIGGEPGAYRLLNGDGPIRLAPNVRGLIESRIGGLSAADRRILSHAAAIGPSFHTPLLLDLSPGRGDAVLAALRRLTSGGFMAEAPREDVADRHFRHGLYQEVAYAMLAQEQRRVLHARILACLRQAVAKNLPGRIEQLARHARLAEDWGLAYVFGRAAGRLAEQRCQHAAAADHYADADDLLDHLPPTRRRSQRRIDLLIAQPLALLPQGGRGNDQLLEHARSLATEIEDLKRRAVAASILGSYQWAYGDIDAAIHYARLALADIAASGQTGAEIPVRIRLGGMLADKGHYRAADEQLQLGLKLARSSGGDRRRGLTLYADVAALAFASPAIGELKGAAAGVDAARQAYDWAMSGEHVFSQLVACHFLGRACLTAGAAAEAARLLQNSLDLAESIRCRIYLPLTMAALGLARAQLGDPRGGGDLLAAGQSYAERLGVRRHRARIRILAAQAHLLTGAADAAHREAKAAAELAGADRQDGDLVDALLAAAEAAVLLGDRQTAADRIDRMLTLCEPIGALTTRDAALALRRRIAPL